MAGSNPLAAFTLDDFEVRSGSATSILRTITGLYLRHAGRPLPRTLVVELAVNAGIGRGAAQTALTRLVDRGLLQPTDDGLLLPSEPAAAMFARGNRRIFTPRHMADDDPWVLATYSLPESMRSVRHQLRRHFTQIGGGLVAAGLWIFPGYLHEEVDQVLAALRVRDNATLFTTGTPEFPGTAAQAAAAWWDLGKLAERHRAFMTTAGQLQPMQRERATSYRCYVGLVDAWRAIPYLDPGLPAMMLPADWPGQASRRLFLELSDVHRQPALEYAEHILGTRLAPPGA